MQYLTVHRARNVSIKSMVVNGFLFAFKLVCGLLIHSGSLVSDAIHSLSDIFSTLFVMIGIKIANAPSDSSHPYGHEKIESVFAFGLGFGLLFIGGTIGFDGIKKIIHPDTAVSRDVFLNIVGMLSAVSSIVLKEWMYRFTIVCAKAIQSKAMEADAWHHRTDAFSSIGSLIGVAGIMLGFPMIDAIACFIISLFILKAAWEIIRDSFNNLVDHACSKEVLKQIEKRIRAHQEIVSLDILKSRMFGSKIYLDMEITVDMNLSLRQAHAIASNIHDDIEANVANIKHCMIHVNPTGITAHHHI